MSGFGCLIFKGKYVCNYFTGFHYERKNLMIRYLILPLIAGIGCQSVSNETQSPSNQPVVSVAAKDTCDTPDGNMNCNFVNMPLGVTSTVTIAEASEPGERLVMKGKLLKADGKTPFPGVTMYLYHTDVNGLYTKKGNEKGAQKWHGYLHGWCKSDQNGQYEIRTIRPGPYPTHTMPAHIHPVIKEPEGNMYFLNDFVFADDSLVNEKYLQSLKRWDYAGGTGVVEVYKNREGTWVGEREIILVNRAASK
jgi:protocatechuate 3,4-dioxygenase beta subunit